MLARREGTVERSALSPACCSLRAAEVKLSETSARAPETDLSISLTLLYPPAGQKLLHMQLLSYGVLQVLSCPAGMTPIPRLSSHN